MDKDKINKKAIKEILQEEVRPFVVALKGQAEKTNQLLEAVLAVQKSAVKIDKEQFLIVKGDEGAPGKDAVITDELIKQITEAARPVKNKDYFDGAKGEPGKSAEVTEDMISAWLTRVTPIKGVHYRDGVDGLPGQKGLDGTEITPEQVRDKLESLRSPFRYRPKIEDVVGLQEALLARARTESGIGGSGNTTINNSGGSSGASSVTASDATLVISPTTGAVLARRAALTGDITAAQGSNATVLATVNSNVGSFTYASITVNAKGLVTAASNGTTPLTSIVSGDNSLSVSGNDVRICTAHTNVWGCGQCFGFGGNITYQEIIGDSNQSAPAMIISHCFAGNCTIRFYSADGQGFFCGYVNSTSGFSTCGDVYSCGCGCFGTHVYAGGCFAGHDGCFTCNMQAESVCATSGFYINGTPGCTCSYNISGGGQLVFQNGLFVSAS